VADPQNKIRREARELLIKTRVYRFFALAFALMGTVIFIFLYFKHLDGRLLEALTDLKTVVMIVVPFLPAAVLAALSAKTESKFYELLHDQSGGQKSQSAAAPPPAKKDG
jgi:hypothetical protein